MRPMVGEKRWVKRQTVDERFEDHKDCIARKWWMLGEVDDLPSLPSSVNVKVYYAYDTRCNWSAHFAREKLVTDPPDLKLLNTAEAVMDDFDTWRRRNFDANVKCGQDENGQYVVFTEPLSSMPDLTSSSSDDLDHFDRWISEHFRCTSSDGDNVRKAQ